MQHTVLNKKSTCTVLHDTEDLRKLAKQFSCCCYIDFRTFVDISKLSQESILLGNKIINVLQYLISTASGVDGGEFSEVQHIAKCITVLRVHRSQV